MSGRAILRASENRAPTPPVGISQIFARDLQGNDLKD